MVRQKNAPIGVNFRMENWRVVLNYFFTKNALRNIIDFVMDH